MSNPSFNLPTSLKPSTTTAANDFNMALELFRRAAQRVPAYKDFLAKNKVKAELVKSQSDFAKVPETDKPSYFGAYPLKDLCWDGDLSFATQVALSSGSTGEPFHWPRGDSHDQISALSLQRIIEDIFQTGSKHTVFVNSLGIGSWMAGLELHNAVNWLSQNGHKITMISPSIDKAIAIRQLKKLLPSAEQVIICGYPPFVKDIVEYGIGEGVQWSNYDIRLLTAGEAISEPWRDRMLKLIGAKDPLRSLINFYGMAETGMSAHETPLSISLRRYLESLGSGEVFERFGGHKQAALYQYYPSLRYYEVNKEEVLLLTAPVGLPLIRYNTRDRGGILDFNEAVELAGKAIDKPMNNSRARAETWNLPFIYLFGRKDLSVTIYALNVYSENIKTALDSEDLSSLTTGIFVMETKNDSKMDQYLAIEVELSEGQKPSALLNNLFTKVIVATLQRVNSEYNKLYSSAPKEATPRVTLVPKGSINYTEGRKHKWVKHD
jgi:phenylacetate-CoA ligase